MKDIEWAPPDGTYDCEIENVWEEHGAVHLLLRILSGLHEGKYISAPAGPDAVDSLRDMLHE